MALRFYAIALKPAYATVAHGFDGVDAAIDAALAQEDIDDSEDAEAAVEAIRTAFSDQTGHVTVLVDDSVVLRRDDLKRAFDQLLANLSGSDAFAD